ncbi:FG-GAP repeat domain-containing protein [Streptomyces sp. NPDC001381]|uniref:FG-GAP repeat domain-containing protein n=1 Tax=Streptomyces sp. NPDC001381 TaxID=3364567 RepID=UPI003698DD23
MTTAGALVADVDGDGFVDRVADPSHTGRELTLSRGTRSGFHEPVGPRELVDGSAGSDEQDILAAVADFDQDGWSDLVVVALGERQGDDPIVPRVADLVFGPFSDAGRGQRTRRLDLGETRGIAVADYDHDRHPDLAVLTHSGDGVYEIQARLGNADTGLADATRRTDAAYTVPAGVSDGSGPGSLPRSGLAGFYLGCEAN